MKSRKVSAKWLPLAVDWLDSWHKGANWLIVLKLFFLDRVNLKLTLLDLIQLWFMFFYSSWISLLYLVPHFVYKIDSWHLNLMIFKLAFCVRHSVNIRLSNSKKIPTGIWHYFSNLLGMKITKIWKNKISHGGFFRAALLGAKMSCPMGWIGLAT